MRVRRTEEERIQAQKDYYINNKAKIQERNRLNYSDFKNGVALHSDFKITEEEDADYPHKFECKACLKLKPIYRFEIIYRKKKLVNLKRCSDCLKEKDRKVRPRSIRIGNVVTLDFDFYESVKNNMYDNFFKSKITQDRYGTNPDSDDRRIINIPEKEEFLELKKLLLELSSSRGRADQLQLYRLTHHYLNIFEAPGFYNVNKHHEYLVKMYNDLFDFYKRYEENYA